MKYAELIRNAWDVTLEYSKLKWFIFVPSFVAVIIFALEILWQLFMYLEEWGYLEVDIVEAGGLVLDFILSNGLVFWILFLIGLILLFAYILPAWVEGVLISSIKQICTNPEAPFSLRQKMVQATGHFFKLFELRALSGIFSPWTVILFSATLYRYHHDALFSIMWPLILGYGIFCVILTFFTMFAEHYIVFEDAEVIESLRKSCSLVFINIGSTLAVLFIMFLVNLRVIINVLVILGVPVILLWIFTYFTNTIILGISVILALVLLGFTSYLTGILDVFSTTVWTKTFLRFLDYEKIFSGGDHSSS